MLALPDVTLVCAFTVCHDLTLMAVDDCLKHVNFGDVKLFTDKDIGREAIRAEFANLDEAAQFTTYRMPDYIKTSHILYIQWDSWVIDPEMWNNAFLEYDYIGAPWWHQEYNVGNSGFNLRSKALLDFLVKNREEFPLRMPEDVTLCRQYQPRLPQFKWAPESIASRFSFERSRPSIESRHFGFHGLFNWPFVLSPDKMAERMAIVRSDPYTQKSKDITELDDIARARWFPVGSKITKGV